MWVYNPKSDFTPDEVEVWRECGMTIPMTPSIPCTEEAARGLIPFLDRAAEYGMKMIVNCGGVSFGALRSLGEEELEKNLRTVYEPLKGHPALYGFFIGDEPSDKESLEATAKCFEIQHRVAPELKAYVNLCGDTPVLSNEVLGGRTLEEYFIYIREKGASFASLDLYGSMINEKTLRDDIYSMKVVVGAAEKAGIDIWANTLSSAHYAFRKPNYHELLWQITVPAACGCRGNIWFRFYDRKAGHEYFGSPVDEYGNKTDTYYNMLRAQRRFADHYGEIMPTLRRKSSYMLGDNITDVFPRFKDGDHDLVKVSAVWDDILVSFFEDDNGKEYICAVNAMTTIHGSVNIEFDPEKCAVREVTFNGADLSDSPASGKENIPLYAGQMRLFVIEKK